MSIITDVIQSTKAIIQGMGVTLSYIPKRKWTVQYPDEPVTVQPRYRGQHLLHVDELGREKCVACYLCAAACPSECIYIVAADDSRRRTLRRGLQHRLRPLHFLRLLRRGLSERRDHPRVQFRALGLQSRRSP